MSENTQKVRLTIEYDVEIFEGDPEDMYELCALELENIHNWGFDSSLPRFDQMKITMIPLLGVNT